MSSNTWKRGDRKQVDAHTYVVCDHGKEGKDVEEHFQRFLRENPGVHVLHMDIILMSPDPLARLFQMIEEQNMKISGDDLMKHVRVARALMEKKSVWQKQMNKPKQTKRDIAYSKLIVTLRNCLKHYLWS
jgi:hypothetical protein